MSTFEGYVSDHRAPLALFIVLMAAVTAICARLLLSVYIEQHSSMDARVRRWLARWEFEPSQLGGFSYFQLALASLLGLFLEMLMIRWISSEIRIFAYFKNFVLISCFLGFGIGASLCRRRINLAVSLVPILLLTVAVTGPLALLHQTVQALPTLLGATSEVQVWGVPYVSPGRASLAALALGVMLVLPLFMLVAFIFIPVGQMVGWYLEAAAEGVSAYTVNVLASLAGIVLYTVLCFLYLPPISWFALTGLMLMILLWRMAWLRWSAAAAFAVFIVLLLVAPHNPRTQIYWSPYQKLAITPRIVDGEIVRYALNTNDSWYQQVIDLSPAFAQAHPALFSDLPLAWNAYNIPYHFYRAPPSVLVLGSGMGNDVAAALRNGAGRIVAVEIDPLILRLGRRLHFEKPYDSPRVQVVVDDARSYIQNSDDRFDLIAFSLLDSHTTSSHFSNIRIDNYVYTVEALQSVRRLLRPDGVFIVKFQVNVPWLAGRLERLLTEVFGQTPLRMEVGSDYSTGGHFFITGSEARLNAALSDPALSAFVRSHGDFPLAAARSTTDDWPYFYQRAPGLPLSVIVLSGMVVLACWYFARRTVSGGSIRWHFFWLGAGFLLLEAQIVSKMALLFGTTWMVNSIVVSGLLLLIIASNFLVKAVPRIPAAAGYAGIFASMALSYFMPLEKLFLVSFVWKALAASLVLCLPVFFAGIVFIRSFAAAEFSGAALGSNLLGALVGGVLESLSLWTGLRSLLLIAVLLYAASAIALRTRALEGVRRASVAAGS